MIKVILKLYFLIFLSIIFQQTNYAGTPIENKQINLEQLQKKIDQLDAEIKKNTATKKA